jgi:hypothetical protein
MHIYFSGKWVPSEFRTYCLTRTASYAMLCRNCSFMVLSGNLKSWITATVGWLRRFVNGSISKNLPVYDCGLHFRT